MEEEPELHILGDGDMGGPAEVEDMPTRLTIADLMSQALCSNTPPDGTPIPLPDTESCRKLQCVFCPAAGCVWIMGFGLQGQWKKVTLLELAGPTLDPRVWRKLPPELLPLIVARLPTDGIARARALSKSWNQALSSSSDIIKECSRSQPTLCALMSFSVDIRLCWVRAYDTHARRWHAFNVDCIPAMYSTSITSSDAGLACLVATGADLQPIFLCNPLTKQWRQLPLNEIVLSQPMMVQLKVDRNTGSYKVTLVGHGKGYQMLAEVYDSVTDLWTPLLSGKVVDYFWPSPGRVEPDPGLKSLGVYDASTEELHEYTVDSFPPRPLRPTDVATLEGWTGGWEVQGLAVHGNELFLLEAIPPSGEVGAETKYQISKHGEGRWGFNATGVARFDKTPGEIVEFTMPDLCECVTLYACRSFYLVVGGDLDDAEVCNVKVYDVATKSWTRNFEVRCEPGRDQVGGAVASEDLEAAFVCELRWDACP